MKLPILVACGLGAAVLAAALFLVLRGSDSGAEAYATRPEGVEVEALLSPDSMMAVAHPPRTPDPAATPEAGTVVTADEDRDPVLTGRVISYQGAPIADAALVGYDRSGKSRRAAVAPDWSFPALRTPGAPSTTSSPPLRGTPPAASKTCLRAPTW